MFPAQNGFFTPPEFTRGMTSLSLGPHYEAHSGAILQHRPPCLLAELVSTARTRPSALASLVSAAHQSIKQPLNPSGQSHLSDGSLFAGSAEAQNSVPHAPMPPFSRAFAASLLRSAATKPPSLVESFQHAIALGFPLISEIGLSIRLEARPYQFCPLQSPPFACRRAFSTLGFLAEPDSRHTFAFRQVRWRRSVGAGARHTPPSNASPVPSWPFSKSPAGPEPVRPETGQASR